MLADRPDTLPELPTMPAPAPKSAPRAASASALDGIRETLASLTTAVGQLAGESTAARAVAALAAACDALEEAVGSADSLRDAVYDLNTTDIEDAQSAIESAHSDADSLADAISYAAGEARSALDAIRDEGSA
jgi:hypothetical protein